MSSEASLRTALEQGRLDDAWTLYKQLHAAGGASAETHFIGGRVALRRNDLFEAKSVLLRALGLCSGGPLLGQIRLLLGEVERRIGEVDEAVAHLQSFLEDVGEYADLGAMWQGAALYNLALTYRQAGRHEESRSTYRQAVETFRQANLREPLLRSLHNLAWVACIQGDAEEAAQALDEAERLVSGEEARWRQRLGRSFLLATLGHYSKAMDLCGAIVRAEGRVPPDVRSHACWIAGNQALRTGRYDVALAMAEQALHHANQSSNDVRLFHDAAELFRAVRSHLTLTGTEGEPSPPLTLVGIRET
ncbi:MAG: tetratricopeptide repeat protein [Bacillota bacterium]